MDIEHRDAAVKLAELEDRLVDRAGPNFGQFRQITEARRRLVFAGQWLRLARQDDKRNGKLKEASVHIRKALHLAEEAGREI